ncbi:hypothetical protein V5P93_003525 [Actinokineospora auranticolor]|uniref:VOC family protein n=1 Tax=Actinokineospora auranticolor TaxID=155976 RepID=A0A2S6GPN3_9PSEU|nr:hypothetical protein [Actinokineospora auranticolor]PPK67188.1 hypothetical protein CLV40_108185 [Actinokineospora auranticolor]
MPVVPILPCASIDDVQAFYTALGFELTYRQLRPNPCLGVRLDDIDIQFAAIPGFHPADSYGSCIVAVPDTAALHERFAAGLRATYGKVPLAGIPRMTRPRPRENGGGGAGFTVIDPGGNWIRIFPTGPTTATTAAQGKLAQALENAVVQADSRGDLPQAAKILDGALARDPDAPVTDRVEALAYRAEVAISLGDPAKAATVVAEIDRIPLTPELRDRLATTLTAVEDLRRDNALPN